MTGPDEDEPHDLRARCGVGSVVRLNRVRGLGPSQGTTFFIWNGVLAAMPAKKADQR